MTIAPLTPAAAPVPTPGAPAGSNTAGDFLAEMLQALTSPVAEPGAAPAEPVVEPAEPVVEPAETPAPTAGTQPSTPTSPRPGKRDDRKASSVDGPDETPTPTTGIQPSIPSTSPRLDKLDDRNATSPRLDKLDDRNATSPRLDKLDDVTNPGKHLGTVANPGLHLGLDHSGHPVNPKHTAPQAPAPASDATDQRPAELPAELPTASPGLDRLDHREAPVPTSAVSTPATVTTVPAATTAPVTATATAATTPTVSAPSPITDQVFGEITGLTSRGNGTHRITMKLQPEALGEVRVVLTVRDGAVHVRLAAGQEARAALLDGSPELRQLLERAGATETRIVVRELPAAAVQAAPAPTQPATQTPTTDTASTAPNAGLIGGDRSPDRHAGTRADHLATDGDDTRGHRTGGRRDVTPIRSAGSNNAVDLTM